MTNYNRRPNTQYQYPKYDKIYYISQNQDNPDKEIEKLNELFENHTDFVKEITDYQMDNKYKKSSSTTFISIKLTTSNLDQKIFNSISTKINKKFNKEFKIWMKTSTDNKYIFTPVEKPKEQVNSSISKFLEDE